MLDIFEEEGVDLRAMTVGHCNDSLNKDYVIGLARRGVTEADIQATLIGSVRAMFESASAMKQG